MNVAKLILEFFARTPNGVVHATFYKTSDMF